MTVTFHSLRGEYEEWLISLIKDEMTNRNAGRVARALTLAGFLDAAPAATRLWKNEIEPRPLTRWLEPVRDRARICFDQNVHARHWFAGFCNASDADEAYARPLLFEACLDRRHALWGQRVLDIRRNNLLAAWLLHVDATVENRRNRSKKIADERKKTLYHTATINYLDP